MGRMKDAPPVPAIPTVHFAQNTTTNETTHSTSGHRIRKMNSFVRLDTVKRGWEESFGEEKPVPRKRPATFLGRLQTLNLHPPNPHRQSRYLTSFDDLFKPELPSAQRYPFKEDGDSLRERIRQGMEDSIIPSTQVTPSKTVRVPLKERIRGMMNKEKPKKRRRGWLEKIVGKKQFQPVY